MPDSISSSAPLTGLLGSRANDILSAIQNGVQAINNAANTITTKISSVVTATPGGSSGQVQFNNTGVFGGFTLGGDATLVSSAGTLTIGSSAITYAKIQGVNADKLLGNPTGSSATVSEITIGAGLSFSGSTLINTISSAPPSGLTYLGTVNTVSSQIVDTSTTSNLVAANNGTYRSIELIFRNIIPTNAGVTLEFQVHSGGAFQTTSYVSNTFGSNGAGAPSAASNTTFIQLTTTNSAAAATPGLSGELKASNLGGSSQAKIWFGQGAFAVNGGGGGLVSMEGYWNGGTGAVDGFQIIASAGAISSGNVDVYGRL